LDARGIKVLQAEDNNSINKEGNHNEEDYNEEDYNEEDHKEIIKTKGVK